MVEPADAKDLIDEAIERAEEERDGAAAAERAREKRFRDRVSILVGICAVILAVIHMAAAGAARESLLKGIEASDTFNYMQAKIVRENVAKAASQSSAVAPVDRAAWAAEAHRLRTPDVGGHAIPQLEAAGKAARADGERAASAVEGYEVGETAMQLAIVLLSIALVARSRGIVAGALLLAAAGTVSALVTVAGIHR
ncbi:MAG: DUF4337 family protein [Sphingomonadaceae bacterium]|nr:DUF4337 family protein [Sphingomonadaceae bacterium]